MRNHFAILMLALCTGCAKDPLPCPSNCSTSDFPSDKRILIIGLDGCRTDALQLAATPTLDELAATGKLYVNVERGPHTVSAPGWSAILTGVWSDKHGVTDNSYDGSDFQHFPDLYTRLRSIFSCSHLYYANSHPIVSKGMLHLADHGLVTDDDEMAAQEAVRMLSQCQPDVLFVHLDNIDAAGHSTGFSPYNDEYVNAIIQTDSRVGTIVRKFEEVYANHQRLVLIATDHGGEGTSHGGKDDDPNVTKVFLFGNTNAAFSWKDSVAEVVDVIPTVMQFLNVPVDTTWALDGKGLLAQ